MADVPAKLVMALHRVTDRPVKECKGILADCNADVGLVFDQMWNSRLFGFPRPEKFQQSRDDFLRRVATELEAMN